MIAYRFAHERYAHDLSGTGSRLYGGRWNPRGVPAVYASLNISLALLELLIHSISYEEITGNRLVVLQIPDSSNSSQIRSTQLKTNWINDTDYTQAIGYDFLQSRSAVCIQVPSAIIPEENNVLINPGTLQARNITIQQIRSFQFDVRLF